MPTIEHRHSPQHCLVTKAHHAQAGWEELVPAPLNESENEASPVEPSERRPRDPSGVLCHHPWEQQASPVEASRLRLEDPQDGLATADLDPVPVPVL